MAKKYLELTQTVHNDKMEEVNRTRVILFNLELDFEQAHRDLDNAKRTLKQVERRLDIVKIDDDDDQDDDDDDHHDEENRDPRMGVALCPLTESRPQRKRPVSTLDLINTEDQSLYSEPIIPVSARLRRSLKRYKRKIRQLLQPEENIEHDEERDLDSDS